MNQHQIIQDPETVAIHRLPARAALMPYGRKDISLPVDFSRSDRCISLNGRWKFAYFERFYETPEECFSSGFSPVGWDEITVPCSWQQQGYDIPQYSNVNYVIPLDPPYLPDDNPCGVYWRAFELADFDPDMQYFLRFEGGGFLCFCHLQRQFCGLHHRFSQSGRV